VPHGSIVYTQSFPSGHSMLAATTYLTIAAILVQLQPRRRLKAFVLAVAVVATLSVGASRVYLGVHWPSDVLAGWAAGAAWAALVWYVARRVQANTRESAAVEPE
jgi:undecaprenyl-diphosphatase